MTSNPFRNATRATRLLFATALLMGLGILMPICAEPSLRATEVAQKLLDGDNPGRHLALGHYKHNVSVAVPDTSITAFISSLNEGTELRLHGYRDSSVSAAVIGAPEPASMLLLSSGLVGAAAAIRKRRRGST